MGLWSSAVDPVGRGAKRATEVVTRMRDKPVRRLARSMRGCSCFGQTGESSTQGKIIYNPELSIPGVKNEEAALK
jgi:hypothetical protein